MAAPLLEVKDLKTYFHINKDKIAKAVDGVSFEVREGEIVAIVGESGSGKSMTSLSIMSLVDDAGEINGSIRLEGEELTDLSERKLEKVRGQKMAMIFQEPMTSLNPVYTIGNQITETLRKHKKMSKSEAKAKAIKLLQLVGFGRAEENLKSYPHELSGGMRQRVMIAIAMSCDPKLLIADEPTTALDVTIQQQILDLMLRVRDEIQSSILLITHDLGVVAETAERVLVMYGGQIVEESPVYDLFTNPLHPYTQGLLNSMPKIEEDKERLEAISGMVPAAHDFPAGCRFAPRCQMATERCHREAPELVRASSTRAVRCFLYKEASLEADPARLQPGVEV